MPCTRAIRDSAPAPNRRGPLHTERPRAVSGVSALVKQFVPILRSKWHPCPLPQRERGVGPLCVPLRGDVNCTSVYKENARYRR